LRILRTHMSRTAVLRVSAIVAERDEMRDDTNTRMGNRVCEVGENVRFHAAQARRNAGEVIREDFSLAGASPPAVTVRRQHVYARRPGMCRGSASAISAQAPATLESRLLREEGNARRAKVWCGCHGSFCVVSARQAGAVCRPSGVARSREQAAGAWRRTRGQAQKQHRAVANVRRRPRTVTTQPNVRRHANAKGLQTYVVEVYT